MDRSASDAVSVFCRWIWILQDLLGIAFCLNFLKTISLSNFKVSCVLSGAAALCCGSDVCLLLSADLCDSAQSAAGLRRLLRLHHAVPDAGE